MTTFSRIERQQLLTSISSSKIHVDTQIYIDGDTIIWYIYSIDLETNKVLLFTYTQGSTLYEALDYHNDYLVQTYGVKLPMDKNNFLVYRLPIIHQLKEEQADSTTWELVMSYMSYPQ